MKVIKPIDITDAVILSSTATETYAAYDAATTYALGDRVTSGNSIYECIQAPSTGNTPGTAPLFWSVFSPTNRWAMFDSEISTITVQSSPLTVTLAPGYANSLALLGVDGNEVDVNITDGDGGPNVYSKTLSLDTSVVTDWYMYFFEPAGQLSELVLTDLPPYNNARVTISIRGATTVRCGQISVGTFYFLGLAEYGATAGIIDFSRKETNATTGVTTFTKRNFSKRMSVRIIVDNAQISRVIRTLSDLRATPAMWVGVDDVAIYAPLAVFGFYRDFSIDVAYPTQSYCSLEIEGLT
jgi:hypothetical protein